MNGPADILVVEDNPDDLDMTLRAIERTRLTDQVEVARDGSDALQYIFCEGRHAGRRFADLPKVILLDLSLPKIDGFEVLKRLKGDARTSAIPVVILTSSREYRDVVEGYQLGVNSYIVKPVSFENFVDAVKVVGVYWLLLNQPSS